MKKLIISFAFLGSIACYISCSNDIDLITEWKDIPIVYGLISQTDTANYIRVEKAFLDNHKSAFEMAQIPDSLYYDNLTVQLKHTSDSAEVYDLIKVDGNLEGFPRAEGIFANAPNFLYKLKLPDGEFLTGGDEYELEINRGDALPLVTAKTVLLDRIRIRAPGTNPENTDPINWLNTLRVEWRSKGDAHIFDATLFLLIGEKDLVNSNYNLVTLEWKILESAPAVLINSNQVRMEVRVSSQELFQFLHTQLATAPNITREFLSFNLLVTGVGEEFAEYVFTGNANTGITSTQLIPTYTNLSEGLGIFSSKSSTLHRGYEVADITIDSLQNHPLTKELNFQY